MEHVCDTCGARAVHGIGYPITAFGVQIWYCHDHWLMLASTQAMRTRQKIDMGGDDTD